METDGPDGCPGRRICSERLHRHAGRIRWWMPSSPFNRLLSARSGCGEDGLPMQSENTRIRGVSSRVPIRPGVGGKTWPASAWGSHGHCHRASSLQSGGRMNKNDDDSSDSLPDELRSQQTFGCRGSPAFPSVPPCKPVKCGVTEPYLFN